MHFYSEDFKVTPHSLKEMQSTDMMLISKDMYSTLHMKACAKICKSKKYEQVNPVNRCDKFQRSPSNRDPFDSYFGAKSVNPILLEVKGCKLLDD